MWLLQPDNEAAAINTARAAKAVALRFFIIKTSKKIRANRVDLPLIYIVPEIGLVDFYHYLFLGTD